VSPEDFAQEILQNLSGSLGTTITPFLTRQLADRIAERDRVLAGHYREELPTLDAIEVAEAADLVPDTERAPNIVLGEE
jgi:hypothetical protein